METEPLTVNQVLRMSLNELSRSVPLTASLRSTMREYLLWLEVHRQNPSSATEWWGNTIAQWEQSIRARGFDEKEVVNGIAKWWQEHRPLMVIPNRSFPGVEAMNDAGNMLQNEHRAHSSIDSHSHVGAARNSRFNDEYQVERTKVSTWEPNPSKEMFQKSYMGKPPGDYICTRCRKPGHYLQVCPTNMDQAYDRPPNPSYVCDICRKKGVHFKDLCPQNQDPYSIIQKRKNIDVLKSTREISKSKIDDQKAKYKLERGDIDWGRLNQHPRYQADMDLNTQSDPASESSKRAQVLENYETNEEAPEFMHEERHARLRNDNSKWDRKNKTINGLGRCLSSQRDSTIDPRKRVNMLENTERNDVSRTRLTYEDSLSLYDVHESRDRDTTHSKRGRVDELFPGHSRPSPFAREQNLTHGALQSQEKRARLDELSESSLEQDFRVDHLFTSSPRLPDKIVSSDEMAIDEVNSKEVPSKKKSRRVPKASSATRPDMGSLNIDRIKLNTNELGTSNPIEANLTALAPKSVKGPSSFMKDLLARHPTLTNVVNRRKPRMTALEMWEKDDAARDAAARLSESFEEKKNCADTKMEDDVDMKNEDFIEKTTKSLHIPQCDGGYDEDRNGTLNRRLTVLDKVKKLAKEIPQRRGFRSFSGEKRGDADNREAEEDTASSTVKLTESKVALVESLVEPNRVHTSLNRSSSSLAVNPQGTRPGRLHRLRPDKYARYNVSDDGSDEELPLPDFKSTSASSSLPKVKSVDINFSPFKFKSVGDRAAYMVMCQLHAMRVAKGTSIREMKQWSAAFKLDYPIPEELLPVLSNDPIKQQRILKRSQQSNIESSPEDSFENDGFSDGFSDDDMVAHFDNGADYAQFQHPNTMMIQNNNNSSQADYRQAINAVNSMSLRRVDSVIGGRLRTVSFAPRISFANQLVVEQKCNLLQELKLFSITFQIPNSLATSKGVDSKSIMLA